VAAEGADRLHIVPWLDPIADPHGVHPCSRYVELYWLGIIGPSTTWLLRRLSYGLEMHPAGLDIDLVDMARSLGLGERMGKNSPFRRAMQRLCTFELARPHGPEALAVRIHIPPLPLRHLSRVGIGPGRERAPAGPMALPPGSGFPGRPGSTRDGA
jgi:hypothetical protein